MEEIIIDGVDVSECEFLQNEDEYGYTCYAEEGSLCAVVNCSACPNCYYKQLKRKEKEYELLNKKLEKSYKRETDLQGQLGEAECLLCRQHQALEKIEELAEEHNCDFDNGWVFLNIVKIIKESEE